MTSKRRARIGSKKQESQAAGSTPGSKTPHRHHFGRSPNFAPKPAKKPVYQTATHQTAILPIIGGRDNHAV